MFKTLVAYDPATLFLGAFKKLLRKSSKKILQDSCSVLLLQAARISIRIAKSWYIHGMQNHSSVKMNKLQLHTWREKRSRLSQQKRTEKIKSWEHRTRRVSTVDKRERDVGSRVGGLNFRLWTTDVFLVSPTSKGHAFNITCHPWHLIPTPKSPSDCWLAP